MSIRRFAGSGGQRGLPFRKSPCGVCQGQVDVFLLKIRVRSQDLNRRPAGSQEAHHRCDGTRSLRMHAFPPMTPRSRVIRANFPMFVLVPHTGAIECRDLRPRQHTLPSLFYRCPSPCRTLRKLARPASRFSMISAARSSGSGRSSRSVRLLSLSQKMSRLVLSRAMISS